MPLSKTRFRKGVIIAADADALEGIEGEIKIDSADNKIKTTLNATPHEVVTNDQSQILSNKTLTSPVINTGVSGTAIDTDVTLAANSDTLLASQKAIKAYVTAVAGAQDAASEITVTPAGTISSTNVQAALQELDTDIQNHLSDATDAHDASAISNVPAGSIAATDVQAAINELDTDIQNHITDSADAHDASAISNVPSGNLAATDVQAALNELQGDIDTNTSGISNHLSDATDAHDASAISVVPTGNLAASDVQAALNELQGDADASNTHIAASTNIHGVGVGNSVVGTGTSQVLTNKTITGADIRTPVRSDVKQDNKANLTTYALTASNGQLCFATDTKEMFQVVDTLLESVGGGAGIGGVDILFSQTFEEAALTDFTQTGMSLSTSSPIHGAISALMTHQAATSQSFKQIVAVDEKFRGQAMLLELNIKSTATAGNVTLNVYDETNAANIVASEQLTLSSATGGIKVFSAFTIPATCLSMSYTITALQEAGSPVTRIDDILCQLNNASLLETSVTVPNITAWQGYTPTFTGFGTATNIEFEWRQVGENAEIRGKFTSGTSTAVEARVGLPAGLTSAGTAIIPSIQTIGYAQTANVGAASFSILAEPSTTYVTFGIQSASQAGLTKQNGSTVIATSGVVSFSASVPCAGLTATSDVAIPLTQSGIVQEADSNLRVAGNAAQAITASVTNIPFSNIEQSIGSDITFNASSFTVNSSGIYSINTVVGVTANALRALSLYKNNVLYKNISESASTTTYAGNLVDYFTSGDVLSFRLTAGATLGGGVSEHFAIISKEGSLKQVTVNTNSKITIPTSELRFEGASARGAVATAIVKFDTMAKIRGDAFTVTNTANDGTYVTMTKAGKLDIEASIQAGGTGRNSISLNQAVLTSAPVASEILSDFDGSGVGFAGNVKATRFVNVGDVLRIAAGNTPQASTGNILNLSFQEQDIQVSVSNTLPQFSESDSSVRLDTANGYGVSGTRIMRFSNVRDNIGTDIVYTDSATNGASFTAMSSGIYNVSFSAQFSVANPIGISKNASSLTTDVASLAASEVLALDYDADANTICSVSWQGYLTSGDIIRPHTSAQPQINAANTKFTMSKVGKPNVTGVDVTPFVNVPQPTTHTYMIAQAQSAMSNLTSEFQFNLSTATIYNSGNSIISVVDDSANTRTKFIANKRCTVEVHFNCNPVINGQSYVYKNGTVYGNDVNNGVAGPNGTKPQVSASLQLEAGEYFSVGGEGSAAPSNANGARVSFTATALSDQILTAPETFSTDTAALTYAGSGTYTLATLANAPVGTFITWTTAISTNTHTQTTAAPTQTTADMASNGIRIFSRLYAAASTAGNPARIAIQIGKGLKGKSINAYAATGKTTIASIDLIIAGTNSVQKGLYFKDYNEVTGILLLDAATVISTSIISAGFEDETQSTQTSTYLSISASKNPALTGLGIGTVAARGVNTSGQSIGNAVTVVTYDAAKTFDTNSALTAATGVYTAQETGYYSVRGKVTFNSGAYASGSNVIIYLYKNGVPHSLNSLKMQAAVTLNAGIDISDLIYLAKGDTLDMRALNERGATTLRADGSENYLAINKANVGN